ncbi:GRF-type domain-containing protein [Raphanus sativus]|nr:GRF-type domain-containing protein [Raphanus sativus]
MEDTGSSSSTARRKNHKKSCHCGIKSSIKKSWTDKNPGILFFGCDRYQDNGCNFFEWYDEGEVTGWPRRSLLEARDELRQKDREIRRLTDQVASLEGELNQRPPQDAQPKAPYLSWKHFIFRCLRPN